MKIWSFFFWSCISKEMLILSVISGQTNRMLNFLGIHFVYYDYCIRLIDARSMKMFFCKTYVIFFFILFVKLIFFRKANIA